MTKGIQYILRYDNYLGTRYGLRLVEESEFTEEDKKLKEELKYNDRILYHDLEKLSTTEIDNIDIYHSSFAKYNVRTDGKDCIRGTMFQAFSSRTKTLFQFKMVFSENHHDFYYAKMSFIVGVRWIEKWVKYIQNLKPFLYAHRCRMEDDLDATREDLQELHSNQKSAFKKEVQQMNRCSRISYSYMKFFDSTFKTFQNLNEFEKQIQKEANEGDYSKKRKALKTFLDLQKFKKKLAKDVSY